MNSNRRSFFKTVGAVAAASVAGDTATSKVFAGPTLPPDGRFFKTSRSILEINSASVGELESVRGGYPFGTVVADPPRADGVVPKRLGAVHYADLVMKAAAGMDAKFYKLLTDFLNRDPEAFSGSISYSDAKFREGGRLEFTDAVITEFQFPKLDGRAKQGADAVTVVCSLGSSIRVKGDASKQPGGGGSKAVLNSDFRVSIDGTGAALEGVFQVQPMIFRQEIISRGPGGAIEVGPLQVGDLVISTSEIASEPLYDWFAKTVETSGNVDERNGKIEVLGPNRAVVFTLNLFNLGIYWLATEDGDESVLRTVTAKMFCERATFSAATS